VPTRKWGSVSMDLITAMPETSSGKTAIVVFVDRLTKMVHLAACKTSIGTQAFAKMCRHEVIRLHGLPYEIVSDRDGRFTSRFMKEVCRMLNIKQAMSTAYHPQTDSQTELTNRILKEMLRQYVSPTHDDWDEHLDMAELTINDAWHRRHLSC
jgi:transposase InsO family protein